MSRECETCVTNSNPHEDVTQKHAIYQPKLSQMPASKRSFPSVINDYSSVLSNKNMQTSESDRIVSSDEDSSLTTVKRQKKEALHISSPSLVPSSVNDNNGPSRSLVVSESFLQLSAPVVSPSVDVRVVPPTTAGISYAASIILSHSSKTLDGTNTHLCLNNPTQRILAFPTETVYNLGASIFDEEAISALYKSTSLPPSVSPTVLVRSNKTALSCITGRISKFGLRSSSSTSPSSSPCSADSETQSPIATATFSEGKAAFARLAEAFWPGALTIVARAATQTSKRTGKCRDTLILTPSVISDDGYVALNCPSHPLSRAILRSVGDNVPLATVPACHYGGIPATRSCQVKADLKCVHGLSILNGEDKREIFAVAPCDFGIESTVVRLDENTRTLVVLRRGAISQKSIERALVNTSFLSSKSSSVDKTSISSSSTLDKLKIMAAVLRKWKVVFNPWNGPGELDSISPNLNNDALLCGRNQPVCQFMGPSQHEWHFVRSAMRHEELLNSTDLVGFEGLGSGLSLFIEMDLRQILEERVIVIDFGRTLANCGIKEGVEGVLSYKDLSPRGSVREAGRHLFLFLRWAIMNRHKVSKVLIADISSVLPKDEHIGGIMDQILLHCKLQGNKSLNTIVKDIFV
mmetsp:Transcript_43643/g.85625  ORF Transcript_43643/g.85625 Transcript_43643/m.85625 type:complete len:636 (+) Transcript_43643:103-2010(+)